MNTQTTTSVKPAAKKQWNVGVNPTDKQTITDLCLEFKRPAAVKGAPDVAASEREIVEIALLIATDRRFKVVPVTETVDGEEVQSFDEDGEPIMETVDLFEKQWETIKARDYSEAGTKTPTIDGIIAQIKRYGAAMKMEEAAIQALIDGVMGKKAETADAPTEA